MVKHGNGVTREAENPLADVKRKIESYYALLEDSRLDLTQEEHMAFGQEINLYYGELTKEEREKSNIIRDAWKPHPVSAYVYKVN